MISAAELILCTYFSILAIGLENEFSLVLELCLVLFSPSGLRANILRCLQVDLHLHASLNIHKGSSSESWGEGECMRLGLKKREWVKRMKTKFRGEFIWEGKE